jgi:hypothetical protein
MKKGLLINVPAYSFFKQNLCKPLGNFIQLVFMAIGLLPGRKKGSREIYLSFHLVWREDRSSIEIA